MSNRILSLRLHDHSLLPAEAVVHVTVVPEQLTPWTEVRGRFTGPRCRYAETIEVAYHLRPLLAPTGQSAITMRAIIPEPSPWSPETPHLYAGTIELWQDNLRCETIAIRHGLRHAILGQKGLRLNGRLLTLRGRETETVTEPQLLAWREAGVNLLVVPASEPGRFVWEMADRFGFLVLGRLKEDASAQFIEELASHPSALGWIPKNPPRQALPGLVGIEGVPMAEARFIVCPPDEVERLKSHDLPFLVLGGEPDLKLPEHSPPLMGVVEPGRG